MQTVEAIIETSGEVRLLEELRVTKPTRALVTVLENGDSSIKGNAGQMLEFLQNNRLPVEARPNAEEMEAQIEENRNSWD